MNMFLKNLLSENNRVVFTACDEREGWEPRRLCKESKNNRRVFYVCDYVFCGLIGGLVKN